MVSVLVRILFSPVWFVLSVDGFDCSVGLMALSFFKVDARTSPSPKHAADISPIIKLRKPPSHGTQPGRLVIVGSGIKSIGQFTLEAISQIDRADRFFFAVADPATEASILEHNATTVDMYKFYDDDKPRHQTYTQMAEVMLREVRKGYYVVGVFYGHPGVFVNPSHRAIAIAISEGYDTLMLPGVSAEDCLFVEIGIDVAP
jgi:hypothetical protein